MSKISFVTNIPQTVSLASIEAELVESQFGGDQHKFKTTSGDVMYVSATVGEIITKRCLSLKIAPREPIVICKAEIAQGHGRKGINWLVNRPNDGTLSVPTVPTTVSDWEKLPGASAGTPAPAASEEVKPTPAATTHANGSANGNGHGNGHVAESTLSHSGWAGYIRDQSAALIDIYASLSKYSAERHGGIVSKEDVRSIVLSCFIGAQKNGGAR